MIVRDGQDTITRALTSAAPFVDEMVVVDTGSTDDTVALARAAGAQVSRFRWVDDFAAARNAALDRARGHWRIFLDADEWLDSGQSGLRDLLAEQKAGEAGWLVVRNQVAAGTTTTTTDTPLVRLLGPQVRYAGRVHEQPQATGTPFATGLVLGHDGYLPQANLRKKGRNATLLLRMLTETPDPDGHLHYQLGKTLAVDGDHRGAVAPFEVAWQRGNDQVPWRHDLLLRYLYSLKTAGGFAEALDLIEAQESRWGDSPDFHYAKADVLLDIALAHPEGAAELVPLVEQSWLRCLALGERPDLHGAVAGRGSFLAAGALAGLYGQLGDLPRQRTYAALAAPPA